MDNQETHFLLHSRKARTERRMEWHKQDCIWLPAIGEMAVAVHCIVRGAHNKAMSWDVR